MYLDEIINKFFNLSSRQRILFNLKELTRYHRIQGSKGLIEAAEFLKKKLDEQGLEVEVINVTKDTDLGLFKIPVEWNVFDAELWIVKPYEKLLLKYNDHPTMVIAHSPPSNGWVEGEVVYVGKGTHSKYYENVDVKGKFVLAYGNARDVYYEASRRGALGILVYTKRAVPTNAVPYYGLFLTEEEAENAKAIAISVSRRIAEEIINLLDDGKKVVVKARVDTQYGSNPVLPVILASLRGREERGFGVIAHYCHPMPGANDNASGVVGLLEVAAIVIDALDKAIIEKPRLTLYFMLVPEYYGTLGLLSLRKDMTKKLMGVVNLDMIGEKQDETNSILTHIMSSITTPTYIDAVIEYALRRVLPSASAYSEITRVLSVKYDLTPYNDGSDHDVFISEGTPALMINQWPDKYYHTDLDDIRYVDITLLARIVIGVASSIYYLASIEGKHLEELSQLTYKFYKWILARREFEVEEHKYQYLLRILAEQYAKGIELISLHYGYLKALELAKKLKEQYNMGEKPSDIPVDDRRPLKTFKGILSISAVKRINREVAEHLMNILERNRRNNVLLMREAINLANGKNTISDIYVLLLAEYGPKAVEFKDLVEFYELLAKIKLIKLLS